MRKQTKKWLSFMLAFVLILTSVPNDWTALALAARAAENEEGGSTQLYAAADIDTSGAETAGPTESPKPTPKQLLTWNESYYDIDKEDLNESRTEYSTVRTYGEDGSFSYYGSMSANVSSTSYTKLNQANIKEAFADELEDVTVNSLSIPYSDDAWSYQWYEEDENGYRTLLWSETDPSLSISGWGDLRVNNAKTEKTFVCVSTLKQIYATGTYGSWGGSWNSYLDTSDLDRPEDYGCSIERRYTIRYAGETIAAEDAGDYFGGISSIQDQVITINEHDDDRTLSVNELSRKDSDVCYYNYRWTVYYKDGEQSSDSYWSEHYSSIDSTDGYAFSTRSESPRQIDSYVCEVQLCYGYQVIDTVRKKFTMKYAPYGVTEEETEKKVRQNAKVKLEADAYINDEDAVSSLAYQWYVETGDVEHILEDETSEELNVKVTDPDAVYRVAVTPKLNKGYKKVEYEPVSRTFRFRTISGYLVTAKSDERQRGNIGDILNLYIDAQVDDGYSLKYEWEKYYVDEYGRTKSKKLGTTSDLKVKLTDPEDFENVYSSQYGYYNYKLTVTAVKDAEEEDGEEEEVGTYEYYFSIMENPQYSYETNAGELTVLKGKDLELYVRTMEHDSYVVEKTWYKKIAEGRAVKTSSDGEEDQYVSRDGEFEIPENYDYVSRDLEEEGVYDSRTGNYIYTYSFYELLENEGEDDSVYELLGTNDRGKVVDIRGDYKCVLSQYRADDEEQETAMSTEEIDFTVKYDSELNAYAKNSSIRAAVGESAKFEVVAGNVDETIYPITYKWEKQVENEEGDLVYETVKDEKGKPVTVSAYEIAEVAKDDFGTYRVTVSDLSGRGVTIELTLENKGVDCITFTPEHSYFQKAVGNSVTMKADMALSEDVDVFYAWYRYEGCEIDQSYGGYDEGDKASVGQNSQYWELIDEDSSSITFNVTDRDFTTFKCEAIYKSKGTPYTKEFFFHIRQAYTYTLENLTPLTQVKKTGSSASYSVRLLTDDPNVTDEKIEYQWYAIRGDKEEKIEGATASTYDVAELTEQDFCRIFCEAVDTESKRTVRSEQFVTKLYSEAHLKSNWDSLNVAPGGDVTLRAEIEDGDGQEFTYQWYRYRRVEEQPGDEPWDDPEDESDDEVARPAKYFADGQYWEKIHGATDSFYTLTKIGENEFGDYRCEITCGEAYFDTYEVNVAKKVKATKIKADVADGYKTEVAAVLGKSAEFAVSAKSNKNLELKYQWYYYDNYTYTYEAIGGATGRNYRINAVTPSKLGSYRCIVTDAEGTTASVSFYLSQTASLDVTSDGYNPSDVIGYEATFGGNVTMTASASCADGYDVFYQWYQETDDEWKLLYGETGASLALTGLDENTLGNYRCDVSDAKGNTQTLYYYVYVNTGLYVVPSIYHATVQQDGSVKMYVTAKADAGYDLSYQWSKWTPDPEPVDEDWDDEEGGTGKAIGGKYVDIEGANDTAYTLDKLTKADYGMYRCVVRTRGERKEFTFELNPSYLLKADHEYVVYGGGQFTVSAEIKNAASDEVYSYEWYAQEPATGTYRKVDFAGAAYTASAPRVRMNDTASDGYTTVGYRCVITAGTGDSAQKTVLDTTVKVLPDITYATDVLPQTVHPFDQRYDLRAYRLEGAKYMKITFDEKTDVNVQVIDQDGNNIIAYVYDNEYDPELGLISRKTVTVKGDSAIFLVTGNADADAYGYKVASIEEIADPEPTVEPTAEPTTEPTAVPTADPGTEPTAKPEVEPTATPTAEPSTKPDDSQGEKPTETPGTNQGSNPGANQGIPNANQQVQSGPVMSQPTSAQGSVTDKSTGKSAADVKNGAVYTVKGLKYKVTSTSAKTVTVTGAKSKAAKKVTIPAAVKISGSNYKVTAVANKAFRGYTKLSAVTVGKNVKKIGASAFAKDKKLKKIIFKGTSVKSIGGKAFSQVPKNAKIKAPKKSVKSYTKLMKKGGFKGKVK